MLQYTVRCIREILQKVGEALLELWKLSDDIRSFSVGGASQSVTLMNFKWFLSVRHGTVILTQSQARNCYLQAKPRPKQSNQPVNQQHSNSPDQCSCNWPLIPCRHNFSLGILIYSSAHQPGVTFCALGQILFIKCKLPQLRSTFLGVDVEEAEWPILFCGIFFVFVFAFFVVLFNT